MILGQLVHSKETTGIPFAHIINLNSNRGTFADKNGFFSINAEAGDKIYFRAIGFQSDTVEINQNHLQALENQFFLDENIQTLKTVVISEASYPTILRKQPEGILIPGLNTKLPKAETDTILVEPVFPKVHHYALGMLSSPFTTLYIAFSKEEKEKRKIAKILYKEQQEQLTDQKFNKHFSTEAISKLLNIETEEAEAFLLKIKKDTILIKRQNSRAIEKDISLMYFDYLNKK
ncbi:carboxypeptidase-like regulatory domain-containing protein [Persicobacter sp. CCB-QB2]|uniref:carboxypeptidase-like regulatory domain-containing protein n=1 Tax=Persicobacter sp. CCB-QB2 TaxID=1561025 RepID=UPI00155D8E52|nr:carboxypeptidase-like regulatory domain-containing protein [Persicobacter sp. CCB-QB2]